MTAKLPPYRPQLALLVKAPPEGDEWLHELKLDGFRIGVAIERGQVTLLSRREKDWTAEFPTVVAGATKLPVKNALLDGELAGVLPDGRTSMHAMGGGGTLAYFAFDILHLDGEDLTALPLIERKQRLQRALGPKPPAPFRYVEHIAGGGADFYREACRLGIEAMISRRADSRYDAKAGWVRVECKA